MCERDGACTSREVSDRQVPKQGGQLETKSCADYALTKIDGFLWVQTSLDQLFLAWDHSGFQGRGGARAS